MRVRRAVARTVLKATGWKHRSQPLSQENVGILIGAPHTSNWDFILMLCITWDLGLSVKYLGKHTLFKRPFGWFMRALGGIPVDRGNPAGIVKDILMRARSGEAFYLVITPEGTRGKKELWKSGFYRIASEGNLPITLGYVDGPTKTTGLGTTFRPTGNVSADMDLVRDFYADKRGVRPELRTEARLREEAPGPGASGPKRTTST